MPLKRYRWAMLILAVALAAWLLASAGAWRIGDRCHIARAEAIDGTLVALCREVSVEGRINGDLVAVAWQVRLSGAVEGYSYLIAVQTNVRNQRIAWLLSGPAFLLGILAQVGLIWWARRTLRPTFVSVPLADFNPPKPVAPPMLNVLERPAPPPRIESHALGMDNLPEGFDAASFFKD